MQAELWSFVGVAALVVIMPGVDMALVARNTLAGGRGAGFRTMAGTLSGLTVHATAAVAGLSALVATSATAFEIVKLAGAAYLIVLGVQTIWATRRGRDAATMPVDPVTHRLRARDPWVQGVLTNVLNPKLAVFFVSFLPQFVSEKAAATPQILLLSAVFVAMGAIWLTVYVVALDSLSTVLTRSAVRRRLDRIVGSVLIGLGLRLGLAARD
jgi:threonine/homoserine/homoserine lactone efflux protein